MTEAIDIRELNERIERQSAFVTNLVAGMDQVIVGQKHLIESLLIGLLSDGHVLLEGVPGLAKTLAIKTLASLIDGKFSRIQFTPDLLPADVIGTMMYSQKEEAFVAQKGPVFANFVLADEINRAPAKVQSALLEAMQERQVTISKETYKLPEPFLVLATQNPIEQEGTYPLPEAQVDRFMVCLSLGYPDYDSELSMAKDIALEEKYHQIRPVLSKEMLLAVQKEIYDIYMKDELYDYLLRLVRATRSHPGIKRGASPRATIALVKMAKATAWMNGRDYVTPGDVRGQFPYVVPHRILLSETAAMEGKRREQILREIMEAVEIPSMGEGCR